MFTKLITDTTGKVSHQVCLSEIYAPVYAFYADNRPRNLFGVFPLSPTAEAHAL